MPEINQKTALNRYPGVKPFSVSEAFLFFGRQSDLEALNTLIFIKQTVVLYGKSGYGKSSLINAGIIPKLKENDSWTYFSIRFNNYSEKKTEQNLSPSQTVKQRLLENVSPEKDNVLDRLIPNEDSFWYWVKQHQLQTEKANYIFFFDQFEELFTYPQEQINEYSEQLSQLLYNTLPLKFKKKIAETGEKNHLNNEEHDFLYEKPEVKVVFSIRSDRLSLLNTLTDKHPEILQHCYELNALNVGDAEQAIIEPAKLSRDLGFKTSEFRFAEKAVEKILSSVADPQDGKIEAATLQIVCRYVEDNLVAVKKNVLIDDINLGDIADIFQQYYQGILSKLTDAEKFKAQHLIEDELIDGDRRNPLSSTYIKTKFGLSDSLLARLEQSSLLRKERDASGRILYEVSHDSLIKAIEKVAQRRRKSEEDLKKIELEKQIAEERKRAQELESLNKKAVFRFKLAIGLVICSLTIAAIAVYFRLQSEKAFEMAENEKNNANRAYWELKKGSDVLKVKEFMSAGKEFESINNFFRACETYNSAKSILLNYPEEEVLMKEIKQNMKSVCGK